VFMIWGQEEGGGPVTYISMWGGPDIDIRT
jgi:hypothetical protein